MSVGLEHLSDLKRDVAHALAPLGGRVQLTQGTFNCSGAVRMRRRTTLVGQGRSTILRAVGTWAAFDGTSPGAASPQRGRPLRSS